MQSKELIFDVQKIQNVGRKYIPPHVKGSDFGYATLHKYINGVLDSELAQEQLPKRGRTPKSPNITPQDMDVLAECLVGLRRPDLFFKSVGELEDFSLELERRKASSLDQEVGDGDVTMGDFIPDGSASVEDQVVNEEVDREFIERLQSVLTKRQFDTVMRKHFEGYTTNEIAGQMGISRGGARSNLTLANKRLRYYFKK